jgi:hypothetical protein
VWSGRVTNTPETRYIGEKEPTYEVIGEGIGKTDAESQSSDFAMAFVDKDLSKWNQIDCKNWSGSFTDYRLDCSSSDALRIGGGDFEKLTKHYTDPPFVANALGYKKGSGVFGNPGYVADYFDSQNEPPFFADSLFPLAPILWSAFYYVPNEGVTPDKITAIGFKATHNLLYTPTGTLEAGMYDMPLMQVVDWANPQPRLLPEDPDDPHELGDDIYYPAEYASCDSIDYWGTFHGMNVPQCLFAGLYAIDEPEELPVRDATAMFTHSSKLYIWESHTNTAPGVKTPYDESGEGVQPPGGVYPDDDPDYTGPPPIPQIWFDKDHKPLYSTAPVTVDFTESPLGVPSKKMLVFYMAYKPIRVAVNNGVRWFGDIVVSDELMGMYKRTQWSPRTQIFLKGGMFVDLANVAVYCNGFTGNDVAPACNMIKPGSYPSMIVDVETSIMVPPFTTRSAALESLFGLYPATTIWGDWGIGLEAVIDRRGTIEFDASEPGVSVQATRKMVDGNVEGAVVGGMTVVYAKGHGSSDNRTIHAWTTKWISIDADGDPATPGTRSGYLDLSGASHSEESATGAAISYIAASGGKKTGGGMTWEGSITLRAIYGAAFTQAGYEVNCGDVFGALITSVSVDVDSETTTLSLGGTGYQGRYEPVRGLGPDSATPYQKLEVLPLNLVRLSQGG